MGQKNYFIRSTFGNVFEFFVSPMAQLPFHQPNSKFIVRCTGVIMWSAKWTPQLLHFNIVRASDKEWLQCEKNINLARGFGQYEGYTYILEYHSYNTDAVELQIQVTTRG